MALRDMAQAAGLLQVIAHATAKAGMFMAAGLVYLHLGHDRTDDLAGPPGPCRWPYSPSWSAAWR